MNAWQTQLSEKLHPLLKAYRNLSLSAEFYCLVARQCQYNVFTSFMPPVQMLYVAQRLRDRDPGGGCAAVGRDVSGTVVVLFTLGFWIAESGSGNSPARSAA